MMAHLTDLGLINETNRDEIINSWYETRYNLLLKNGAEQTGSGGSCYNGNLSPTLMSLKQLKLKSNQRFLKVTQLVVPTSLKIEKAIGLASLNLKMKKCICLTIHFLRINYINTEEVYPPKRFDLGRQKKSTKDDSNTW